MVAEVAAQMIVAAVQEDLHLWDGLWPKEIGLSKALYCLHHQM